MSRKIRILKSIFKIKINLLVALGLAIATFSAPNLYFKMLRAYVGPSVYLMTSPGVPRGSGTGFVVDYEDKQFLITNSHVCGLQLDGKLLAKSRADSFDYSVIKILKDDPEHDICVLEAPENASGLSLHNGFDIGDTVHVLGHPIGYPLHRNSGEIITQIMIQIDYSRNIFIPEIRLMDAFQLAATISPGNSGSPVVNHFGQVIGIIFAGSSINSYTAFFIHARHIIDDLKGLK